MGVNFDEAIERRHTNCSKYDGMTASFGRNDLLPLWIADMDFPVPEAVTEAVKKRTEHPVYGYNVFPEGYYAAFAAWTAKHHNWSPDPSWVCHTPGVLTALSTAILAFTKPGGSVLIQPPVYFPFQSTLEALDRRVLNNQLVYKDGYFTIDFEDFEEKAKEAVLQDAGVSASAATFTQLELERDDGRWEYEIDFFANGTEYEYTVDAQNGTILKRDSDYNPDDAPVSSASVISMDEAKALAQAKAPNAVLRDISFDYDDGIPVYEGELREGNTEYEFEIDARNGSFLKWEADHD